VSDISACRGDEGLVTSARAAAILLAPAIVTVINSP